MMKCFFLLLTQSFPSSMFWPFLSSCCCTPAKRACVCPLTNVHAGTSRLHQVPRATSSPGWTVPFPWNVPCRICSPDPWLVRCLFSRPTEFYQHVSCAWGARLNATTRCGVMRVKKRRIILKNSKWLLNILNVCLMVLAQLALLRQSVAQCSIYP